MTAIELKTEIKQELEKVPESVLQNVLEYLKQAQYPITDKKKINEFIDKIFKEDHEVLKRLAQ